MPYKEITHAVNIKSFVCDIYGEQTTQLSDLQRGLQSVPADAGLLFVSEEGGDQCKPPSGRAGSDPGTRLRDASVSVQDHRLMAGSADTGTRVCPPGAA